MVLNIKINAQLVLNSDQEKIAKSIGVDEFNKIHSNEIKKTLETWLYLRNIELTAFEENNVPFIKSKTIKIDGDSYDECTLCNYITLVKSDCCKNCGAIFIRDNI